MKIILSSLAWFCCISIITGQQLYVKTVNGITTIPASESPVSALLINNEVVVSSGSDNIRLIVQLNEPSRSEAKQKGISFSAHAAGTVKEKIYTVIRNAKIENEFTHVFNGFSILTQRENIPLISSLDGVKNVYPDVEVHTSPVSVQSGSSYVPQRSASASSGKGVRIGVIDTGVDYLHEAFGGGFGSTFQIAGGFDFVNNDTDPMDDNGHGTHVTGIIGGTSTVINGSAYNAKIFAYKALDRDGKGFTSTVIAALDRALEDSIDVLNMSIGATGGSSDDPLSQAVNRAVESGIVVVVAAGNTSTFGSINSPGTAQLALTVGASDGTTIAEFSAKGPVNDEYQIKPNVVAPGVRVLSAKTGGGYVEMSGTSMATPFVTAIAAKIIEMHPEWNAKAVTNAIISGSIDLHQSVFSQGNGNINDRQFTVKNFSAPAQLNFGYNPPQEPQWNKRSSVQIYNASNDAVRYSFISQNQNPAVQFQFSPSSVEIGPLQSSMVEIKIVTNNLLLNNNREFENGYTGKILAVSAIDTIIVPYAFFKGNVLQLQFSEIPWLVMIHNRRNTAKTILPQSRRLSLLVEDSEVDVVASFFGSRYVIRENIPVYGSTDVSILSAQAEYPLSFQPINNQGSPSNVGGPNGTYTTMEVLVHRSTGFTVMTLGGGRSENFRSRDKVFSSLSNKYSYCYSLTIQPDNRSSYTYETIIDSGITTSVPIKLNANDLHRVEVKYQLDAATPRIFPITWTSYIGKNYMVGVTFYDGKSAPLTYPYVQQTYNTDRHTAFPIFQQREAYKY